MNNVIERVRHQPSDGGQEADDVFWQRTQSDGEEDDDVKQSWHVVVLAGTKTGHVTRVHVTCVVSINCRHLDTVHLIISTSYTTRFWGRILGGAFVQVQETLKELSSLFGQFDAGNTSHRLSWRCFCELGLGGEKDEEQIRLFQVWLLEKFYKKILKRFQFCLKNI